MQIGFNLVLLIFFLCVSGIYNAVSPQLDRTQLEKYRKQRKIFSQEKTGQEEAKKEIGPYMMLTKEALESAIDPDTYYLGPGDQLLISIWGQVNESFPTFVSPEGRVLIPAVKEIDIRGLTLTEGKRRIIQEMKQVYARADITVSLLSIRSFRVHVTGSTEKAGSVIVTPVHRVSEAIELADGILDTNISSQRNILVYRKTGAILQADLIKRKNAGDMNFDPLLMDGDVIFVPPAYSWVYIYEGVHYPGRYEYVNNERLLDLIKVAGGLVFGADSMRIEISRFTSDTGKVFRKIYVDLPELIKNPGDTSKNIRLQPNDRILVKRIPQFQMKHNITLKGEVQYPGTYPIMDNITKLSEIIQIAGGFTPYASLDNIVIYRDIRYEGRDLEYERLAQTPVMDMNDIEKAYFRAKSRQYYPTVQTDFNKLFEGGRVNSQYDVLLKDGDFIEVGKKKKTVRVIGSVLLPGIVDLEPGKDFTFYINKVGGYTERAKRGDIQIIRIATQSWINASRKTIIEDGDIIFVPEKEPIDGWKIFRETVAMIGQLASVTATIILIIKVR